MGGENSITAGRIIGMPLTHAFMKLFESPELRRQMGEAGRLRQGGAPERSRDTSGTDSGECRAEASGGTRCRDCCRTAAFRLPRPGLAG